MSDEHPDDEPRANTRSTDAEVAARVAEVAALLAKGLERPAILQYGSKWGVSDRTIDNYTAQARRGFAEAAKGDVEEARGELAAMLREQYRAAIAAGDPKAAIAAVRELAKLRGLYPDGRSQKGTQDPDAVVAALLIEMRNGQ